MHRHRILVVNDYVSRGGAEEVYRISLNVLGTLPGVHVESFDQSCLAAHDGMSTRAWNASAARELAARLERLRPDRVLVHNYHNLLSPSILPVLARYKRLIGYRTYLTAHDYHLVFYNPNLLVYPHGRATPLALDDLGSRQSLFKRSSAKGPVHDAIKKLHWHAMRAVADPAAIFDMFLCPSQYMQQALAQAGMHNAMFLPNPIDTGLTPSDSKVSANDALDLAFVGRIAPEKGLDEFLRLAEAAQFRRFNSLTVYGEGPQRAALQQRYAPLIEQCKLRFAGRLDHDVLFEALREHDALLLPSVWAENAPLAIVEAAMLGLPVLVHDLGSLTTFGDEIGNKIKYDNSATGLADAFERLVGHLRLRRGRYDVSLYSPEHYARALASALHLNAPAPSALQVA
jgi:glycosyltransferase involved in cell wall biosynthesis